MTDINNLTDNVIIDSEDIFEAENSDQKFIKVFKSKEELELECKMTTHNELIELGQNLAMKKSKEEAFNKLSQDLQEEFNDMIPTFNIDDIDKSFNLEMFIQGELKNTGFSSTEKKNSIKLFILYKIIQKSLENKENKIEELNDEIKDINEQSDDYIQQIEDIENTNKINELKIAERIVKLRQKCIDRRGEINRLWYTIVFLIYTSLVSFQVFIYQFNYIIMNILTPFIVLIFNNLFKLIYNFSIFIFSYKILFGILIGFIAVYIYLKLSELKNIKKD